MLGRWLFKSRIRNPLNGIERYALYYGHPTDAILRSMAAYDMAIVEPRSFTSDQIARLKASGTRMIGYLSVMETPSWNVDRTKRLAGTDYLVQDDSRHHFPEWDSWLMDLTESHYRRVLLDEIQGQIVAKGFDGIMLDTVGDIEDFVKDAAKRQQLLSDYASMIREWKRRHPSLAFIQNRGFEAAQRTADDLDGFLWEDWDGGWQRNGWMILRVKMAIRWSRRGIRVFTLNRSSEPIHAAEAEKLGFVHLARPEGYNSW